MPTSTQVRREFIDFFVQKCGHTFVPSSPVVPHGDDTLLFTNAGMNQFKDVFLGTGSRSYKRAVNTQKCIRAGGKHNDLDDVGKDTYHHTFFEMLGNWSFGDYFKQEAIAWAWELLTKVWAMDASRLHVTVFEGDPKNHIPRDDEAAGFWRAVGVPENHIHLGNKKDNFWEMGETGPCGPCTEVHIDRTPDRSGAHLVNAGTPDVIEIWNLVFIQFNRNPDGSLSPLPANHVDTGMGFERVTSVLQGKDSNYDTDVFAPIFEAIGQTTGAKPYSGKLDDLRDTAYRVIADHIRTLTFALTDGATLGNEGRNYVLKRILRRAERYGRQVFGTKGPFLCNLVEPVVAAMSEAFPELRRTPRQVQEAIRSEEEQFIRTLDRGIKLFNGLVARAQASGATQVSGDDAFTLHDTYGLYIDITQQMAGEVGLTVDAPGYERAMKQAKDRARAGQKKTVITALQGDLPATDDSPKYQDGTLRAKVVGWVKDNTVIKEGTLQAGEAVALLLDRTNFYGEQGGQVGDTGTLSADGADFEVEDTQRLGESVLHLGTLLAGSLRAGQEVTAAVTPRLDTMRNHTATHLLNWALREVLGDRVEQKGSLVDADKTRFDFTHDSPLTSAQVAEVERLVNDKILADLPVSATLLPLAEAQKLPGVRAVFGEKYPDPVRVLVVGADSPATASRADSIEFCGGTHLTRTSQACLFKILSQEGVAKGVRRITATTGAHAINQVRRSVATAEELGTRFNCKVEDLPTRVEALQEEIKKLQQQLRKGAASDLTAAADKIFGSATEVQGVRIIVGELPAVQDDVLRTQVDRLKQKAGSAIVLVGWADEGKAGLLAAVTDDLVKKGVHAGKLVGEVAQVVGGKGGGRPNMAQAGGPNAAQLPAALDRARELAAASVAKG